MLASDCRAVLRLYLALLQEHLLGHSFLKRRPIARSMRHIRLVWRTCSVRSSTSSPLRQLAPFVLGNAVDAKRHVNRASCCSNASVYLPPANVHVTISVTPETRHRSASHSSMIAARTRSATILACHSSKLRELMRNWSE